MYKITKKYEDFRGNEREESFHFNLTESEMMDMIKEDPSFSPDYLIYLSKEPSGLAMMEVMRKLIVLSYGELSEDGKHFRKDDQIAKDFIQSKAYEEILSDFFDGEHETMVKDFVLNVFPKKYKDVITKQMASGTSVIPVKK